MKTLRPEQALSAVSTFIESHGARTNPPDHFLGDLLSDIQFLADGNTADPASRHEWLDAVKVVTGKREDARLTPEQAFEAMAIFVRQYGARLKNAQEISDFLKTLNPMTPECRDQWLACVSEQLGG